MEHKRRKRKHVEMDKTLEVVQDPFLGAIENNDMEATQAMLKARKSLVRNHLCTKNAFAQAIRDNHMGKLFCEHFITYFAVIQAQIRAHFCRHKLETLTLKVSR